MKRYIGDGVYVDFDGFHVVVHTDGNTIYLEDTVAMELIEYITDVFKLTTSPPGEDVTMGIV